MIYFINDNSFLNSIAIASISFEGIEIRLKTNDYVAMCRSEMGYLLLKLEAKYFTKFYK